jgi:hypothetical protein
VRGSTGWNTTETVTAVTTTDGATGTLTLTGGAYRDGAATRTLATHRANGRPSSQLLDAYPVGAVVAALAAVMGATPTTPDADGVACDGCELCDADIAADAAADADHDAADAAHDDDGATLTTPATMTTGGATVAAPMVGAVSTGGAMSWDRQERRDHGARRGHSRRADARGRRAARRTLKRADRRAAIRDAWGTVGARF